MLAVAPVGQKAKVPSLGGGGASTAGGPMQTNNFEIKSTNDDFAISNNGELEMFKRPNHNEQRLGGSSQYGRNDPRNILGDVYVGKRTPERSPKSYQEVV